MSRFRVWSAVAGIVLLMAALFVARNQLRVHRGRQARAVTTLMRQLEEHGARLRATMAADARARLIAPKAVQVRGALLEALQPVALTNCRLERFGEPHDGGYLMCGNLLNDVRSGYSYGISGYDKWGCDVSTRAKVTVHQYDCFDTRQPSCPGGDMVFHAECVAGSRSVAGGRLFDTIDHQVRRNGDAGRRIVLKIDVEGAEWDSFTRASDALLDRIDQLAVEFHRVADEDDKYLMVVERLKRFFYVAHLHYNNHACVSNLEPLRAWAYEVLFVNKRLAMPNPLGKIVTPHPLDAPNAPALPDCQSPGGGRGEVAPR